MKLRVIPILLLLGLAACMPVFPDANGEVKSTETPDGLSTEVTEVSPKQTATPQVNENEIVIWLPAQFDPSISKAGEMLFARFQEFMVQNPGYSISVRFKAESGDASLLQSLTITSAAVPNAVPSLVMLNRTEMETAVNKNLIHPFTQVDFSTDEDWYDYARNLGSLSGTVYGLPIAGDALVLVYRPNVVSPEDAIINGWEELLALNQPIVFPAGDAQAMFSLALYLSAGGQLRDPEGNPTLQPDILSEVYRIYEQGSKTGTIPNWNSKLLTDDQAWLHFKSGEAQLLVTSVHSYLVQYPADAVAIPLPALNQGNYTLASGWMWAVSDPDPQRREVTESLAQFLSTPEFLAEWTVEAGYLPVRPSIMVNWSNQSMKTFFGHVILAAQELPAGNLIDTLGPAIRDGATAVLDQKMGAYQAATEAANKIVPEQ